jgi:hypothetical protein
MKIYVASSWRTDIKPVVDQLREDGHQVYDFKDSEGFHWTEVDPDYKNWVNNVPDYLKGLKHPCANRGFSRDMDALKTADAVVYVMPCGVSASWEAGYAVGAGKKVYVYVTGIREPDLMVKMADLVSNELKVIRYNLLLDEQRCRSCQGNVLS